MIRTLVQPFLLVFVFLYVFPTIGQGIGGGGGLASESRFATVLVPGVVGISIMFQGIQAVALQLSTDRDPGVDTGRPGGDRRSRQGAEPQDLHGRSGRP